jgi:hypothetical protein
MRSSIINHYILKFCPLVIGLLFITIAGQAFIFPENAAFITESENLLTIVIHFLIGLLFIILYLFFKGRYAVAEIKNRSLRFIQSGAVIERNWIDVESITMIPFLFPPVYKVRLKNEEDYLLFTTSGQGGNILGLTFDDSEAGAIIQKKKRELNL